MRQYNTKAASQAKNKDYMQLFSTRNRLKFHNLGRPYTASSGVLLILEVDTASHSGLLYAAEGENILYFTIEIITFLPCCVFLYLRKYTALEVLDGTGRLVTKS